MAAYLIGGVALSGVAAMIYMARGGGGGGGDYVPEEDGKVPHLKTDGELQALLAKGGKAVVYLTATW